MTGTFVKGFIKGSTLKWIAVIAMFINHFGDILLKGIIMNAPYSAFTDAQFSVIFNSFNMFHVIGRLSMPIFCFLIVEGFLHTRNLKKYLIRLISFAIISEIPYDLAFGNSAVDFAQQNVFFTLSAGLFILIVIDKFKTYKVVFIIAPIAASFIAYFFKFDGSYYGISMMVLFYIFKDKTVDEITSDCSKWHKIIRLKALNCLSIFSLQMVIMLIFKEEFGLNLVFSILALIPIYLYSGERGTKLKYFFYLFYPLHLLVLALVTRFAVIPYFS